jgi:hypothetical protein
MIFTRFLIPLLLILMISGGQYGLAQGRITDNINFNNSVPPGSGVALSYYYETPFVFTPINTGEQFTLAGGAISSFPENGTAYILQGAFNTLSGTRIGSTRFGLYSVDLAEFSRLYAFPVTIQFFGYKADGSIVTANFSTDGVIDGTGPLADFQTFYFGPEFTDLTKFEVPGHGYALDNLIYYNVVPEPSSGALLVLGLAIFLAWKIRRTRAQLPRSH